MKILALILLFKLNFLTYFGQYTFLNFVDSTVFVDVVKPTNWDNLPEKYQFENKDTVIGRFNVNTILTLNGLPIAYGNRKQNGVLNGWWGICSIQKDLDFCCAGSFKRGKKKGVWWMPDCWRMKFKRNEAPVFLHSIFYDC